MDNSNKDNQVSKVPSVGEISEIFGLAAKTADLETKLNHEIAKNGADVSTVSVTPASSEVKTPVAETHAESADDHVESQEITEEVKKYNKSQSNLLRATKIVLPYLAVFGIGIFLYYFYFSDFSFNQIFKPNTEVAGVAKQKNIDELYIQERARFETWMQQYYFNVSDASVVDPKKDVSGNGLTNFQKYILGLNPKVYDTLGRGQADSEYLSQGIDPLTGSDLNDNQKNLIETYIDVDIAVNTKTYPQSGQVWANVPEGIGLPVEIFGDPNGAPITNFGIRDNTKPTTVNQSSSTVSSSSQTSNRVVATTAAPRRTSTVTVASTSTANNTTTANLPATAKFNKLNIPATSNYLNVDLNIPGKLSIPYLNIEAPIIWTKGESSYDSDLEKGVIHLPATAIPGSLGRAYISGHSSGYAFAGGDYKRVFSRLAELPDNSSFTIYVTNTSGKLITLKYIVYKKAEYIPSDPAQFANTAESEVALGTCWPIGGTAKRMVVVGRLDEIKK